jgi:NADPH:quinone reductase-like Zn-dependent oxidoreductase
VVIDNVGGETLRRSYQTLKQNGVLVSVVDPVDERLLKRYGIRGSFFGTQVNAAHLSRLGELVSAGKVAVHLDRQLPLSEAAAAHVRLESRRTRGKVVLCND